MNNYNLPVAWHAAMDMSAIRWGNDCKQFKQMLVQKTINLGFVCAMGDYG